MPEPFTCPRCGRTSHHPTDVREGYCGACHDWTGDRVIACGPRPPTEADRAAVQEFMGHLKERPRRDR